MGTAITDEKGLYAALNNCAFVSTEHMRDDPSKPFIFLMDASMLGYLETAVETRFSYPFGRVGVGFDTKGAGTTIIKGPNQKPPEYTKIPDSREGSYNTRFFTVTSLPRLGGFCETPTGFIFPSHHSARIRLFSHSSSWITHQGTFRMLAYTITNFYTRVLEAPARVQSRCGGSMPISALLWKNRLESLLP